MGNTERDLDARLVRLAHTIAKALRKEPRRCGLPFCVFVSQLGGRYWRPEEITISNGRVIKGVRPHCRHEHKTTIWDSINVPPQLGLEGVAPEPGAAVAQVPGLRGGLDAGVWDALP